MMEYTTPPSYGSTVVNIGGIAKDGEILYAGSDGNSVKHTQTKKDSDNDWTEPTNVEFIWSGASKNGKKVTAKVEGSLGERLDKVDVMEKVPGFIKTLVGGVVGTKPYIYQVFLNDHDVGGDLADTMMQYSPQQKLKINVSVDGSETTEEGELFMEATFIS